MNNRDIAELVAQRRKQLNLRQQDLAEMSGTTVRTVYNIEEAVGNPSFDTLSKVCSVLGLELLVRVKTLA